MQRYILQPKIILKYIFLFTISVVQTCVLKFSQAQVRIIPTTNPTILNEIIDYISIVSGRTYINLYILNFFKSFSKSFPTLSNFTSTPTYSLSTHSSKKRRKSCSGSRATCFRSRISDFPSQNILLQEHLIGLRKQEKLLQVAHHRAYEARNATPEAGVAFLVTYKQPKLFYFVSVFFGFTAKRCCKSL